MSPPGEVPGYGMAACKHQNLCSEPFASGGARQQYMHRRSVAEALQELRLDLFNGAHLRSLVYLLVCNYSARCHPLTTGTASTRSQEAAASGGLRAVSRRIDVVILRLLK